MNVRIFFILQIILITFICNSCLEYPYDTPLKNDYDYLHSVTDLAIYNNKLYLGFKNQESKLLANIDLPLLINSKRGSEPKLNIDFSYIYAKDYFYKSDFIYEYWRNDYSDFAKYINDSPSFIANEETNTLYCLFPTKFLLNLQTNQKINFTLDVNYNFTFVNNKLYFTYLYGNEIYEYHSKEELTNDLILNKTYQELYSFNFETQNVIEEENKLYDLKQSNRFTFNLNGVGYVCKDNSFYNINDKSFYLCDALKNEIIVHLYQANNKSIVVYTSSHKIIIIRTFSDYTVLNLGNYINSLGKYIDKAYISKICLKKNALYLVLDYYEQKSNSDDRNTKLLKYNLDDNNISTLLTLSYKDRIQYDMVYGYANGCSRVPKLNMGWSLVADDNGNIYFANNALFIISPDGTLFNYFNSKQLARMCK